MFFNKQGVTQGFDESDLESTLQLTASEAISYELVLILLSLFSSICVYLVSLLVLYAWYHPSVADLIDQAKRITFKLAFHPEPVESMRFKLAVFVTLPCLWLFYRLYHRFVGLRKWAIASSSWALTLIAAGVPLLTYAAFTAHNPFGKAWGQTPQATPDYTASTNFEYYFSHLFLGRYLVLYALVIVPVISYLIYSSARQQKPEVPQIFIKIMQILSYLFIGSLITAIALMNTYHFPYTFQNKYDFNSVYYSMTQVYAGVPMLVNGFSNTYGLYPHFLNLLFQLTGLSVFKFSLVMALLAAFCLLLNYFVLSRWVANKAILFLGFFSTVFLPYLNFKLTSAFDSYFAFYPIRYIAPITLLSLATIYFNNRKSGLYWFINFFVALSVLWNPEMGIVSLLAWLATNIYTDCYDKNGAFAPKRIALLVVSTIGVLLLVMVGYCWVIFWAYGSWPDLHLLFAFLLLFGKYGFGLLAMPMLHPWVISALIIACGFMLAISKFCRKKVAPRDTIVFMLAVLSVGFFAYYQGRSHNAVFASSTGMVFLLLTILGDRLWAVVKKVHIPALHILFVSFLFMISFSVFEVAYSAGRIQSLVCQSKEKKNQVALQQRIEDNELFINAHSRPHEKILVFSAEHYPGLYFNGNQRRSAFNPGEEDLFLKSDVARMLSLIKDSSFAIFLEPASFNTVYTHAVYRNIASSYKVTAENGSLIQLQKQADSPMFDSVLYRRLDSCYEKINGKNAHRSL